MGTYNDDFMAYFGMRGMLGFLRDGKWSSRLYVRRH